MVSWGDPAFDRVLERACSQENLSCVEHRHNFDDFVRGVSEKVQRHKDLHVTVEYLPGMAPGEAYALDVTYTSARFGAPMHFRPNGDVDQGYTPARARMENGTYASPLYVDLRVETREPSPNGVLYKGTTATNVFLGLIPIMVGSQLCMTHQDPAAAALEIDKGGYFIKGGNEKFIPYVRKTDPYSTVCYLGQQGETFATVRSGNSRGRIQSTRLVKSPGSPAQIKFQNSNALGAAPSPGTVLRALGVSPREVFDHMEPADAMFYGKTSFEASGKASDDVAMVPEPVLEPLDLFPGTDEGLKAQALVSMLRLARYMRETRQLTERDSLQTQQVDGVREVLDEVFDKQLRSTSRILCQRIQTRLGKLHRQRHDGMNHRASTLRMPDASWVAAQLTKHNTIGPGVQYFFATGNIQGGGGGGRPRTGLVQMLQRTTELEFLGCFNKVVTSLDAQSAPTSAREYKLDMLGYLCPVATPEGKCTRVYVLYGKK